MRSINMEVPALGDSLSWDTNQCVCDITTFAQVQSVRRGTVLARCVDPNSRGLVLRGDSHPLPPVNEIPQMNEWFWKQICHPDGHDPPGPWLRSRRGGMPLGRGKLKHAKIGTFCPHMWTKITWGGDFRAHGGSGPTGQWRIPGCWTQQKPTERLLFWRHACVQYSTCILGGSTPHGNAKFLSLWHNSCVSTFQHWANVKFLPAPLTFRPVALRVSQIPAKHCCVLEKYSKSFHLFQCQILFMFCSDWCGSVQGSEQWNSKSWFSHCFRETVSARTCSHCANELGFVGGRRVLTLHSARVWNTCRIWLQAMRQRFSCCRSVIFVSPAGDNELCLFCTLKANIALAVHCVQTNEDILNLKPVLSIVCRKTNESLRK